MERKTINFHDFHGLEFIKKLVITVEPPNKGHLSIKDTCHTNTPLNKGHFQCSECVPYSEVFLYILGTDDVLM